MNTLITKKLIKFLFSSFFITTITSAAFRISTNVYTALQSNDTKKEEIEKLVAQDKDFFERIDDQKNTALHIAVRSGIVQNVATLLGEASKKNISIPSLIEVTNDSGKTVIDLAQDLATTTTRQVYKEIEKRLRVYLINHQINQLKRQLGELELQKKVLIKELKEINKK